MQDLFIRHPVQVNPDDPNAPEAHPFEPILRNVRLPSVNKPRVSRKALPIKNGRTPRYWVKDPFRDLWLGFSIEIDPDSLGHPHLMRLKRRPPLVMTEAIVIIKGRVYHTTPKDIFRGVVRKHRDITEWIIENERTDCTKPTSAIKPNQEQPTAQRGITLEESQAADIAWEQQAEALLQDVIAQEGGGWEISPGNSQS